MTETYDFTPEQEKVLDAIEGKMGYNADFVSLETYQKIFDSVGVKAGDKILDLGAGFTPIKEGASLYTQAINDKGARVIALDKKFIRALSWLLQPRERRYENETMASPVMSDAFHLPFEDKTFEGTVSINLLNELTRKELVLGILQEAYRVLKDNSFMIISTFGYFKINYEDGSATYNDNFAPEDLISKQDIQDMALQAGFKSPEVIPMSSEAMEDWHEYLSKKDKKKYLDFKSLEIVEPTGLLLRK